ncbi:MAG: GNAT family N-acetyltransferase [Chlorobium sp.]|uniref:GNAT family N-acetyltransferase n=1 Tax=Chlorobium sp. TaxID=1095 RepID=UPI002F42F2CB
MKNDLIIRTMTRKEVDMAVDWAAAEGWNPGIHDADCFWRADTNGFVGGWLGDEQVAAISVVRYGSSFGFLGFYIVRPDCRGKGYGLQVWNAGLERLDGRTVGLDGVIARQENYRKSGFSLAWNNARYEGKGGGETAPGVIPVGSVPKTELYGYDRQFFAEAREAFLECWISRPGTQSHCVMNGGRLAGYGVARPCRNGYKIGPLFADTPEIADDLFVSLKAGVPETESFFLDIPMANIEAVALVDRHGMHPVFETARMYRGEAPEIGLPRTYGITSFELG